MGGTLRRGAAALIVIGATACTATGTASAASPRARVGSEPALPATAHVAGALPRAHRVPLVISLQSRNPLAMARMATEVATPGSSVYRHYLSVHEFAARFGARAAEVATVQRTLRADGLHVGRIDPNRLTLDVSGTAARVEHAFATRLAAVRMADGRRAYADRAAPTLPAAIAPDVDAVVGLNDLYSPQSDEQGDRASGAAVAPLAAQPNSDVATGGPQPCATATKVAANPKYPGYTADVIQAAYNFAPLYAAGDHGGGQTVAVYELQGLDGRDIRTYQACYGTKAHISIVKVGRPQPGADDEESALDVEQIIGLAPKVHVMVYESADNPVAGLRNYAKIMSQDRAKTISVSWGECESRITLDGSDRAIVKMEDKLFQEAALQGQSILAASGDTGSAACYPTGGSTKLSVQDPASQPFATGVGGTTLYTNVAGTLGTWNPTITTDPLLESVWNDGKVKLSSSQSELAASTGGISRLWAMPKYQRAAAPALGVVGSLSSGAPCHASVDCREIPDVSADGDPASGYVVHVTAASGGHRRTGWTIEGGTSAAAPVWAALTALTNGLPACRHASVGFENPALYALDAAQPGDLRDITLASPFTGRPNNDAIGTNHGLYPVAPGYDMTTGLGVPNAASLASGMCALRAPVYSVSVTTPASRTSRVGSKFRLALTGADSGGLRLRYFAHGLPTGLSISRRGVISGRPRHAGHYAVRVTARDHATNQASVHFTITVKPRRTPHKSHRHHTPHKHHK